MVEIKERIGRFTSSNIWKLTTLDRSGKSFGAPALTYIEEKRAERSLGRSIDLGKQSQATIWGKVMEHYCNKFHLDLSYTFASKETDVHPKYKFWSGSKDFVTDVIAGDIKSNEPKRHYELTMNLLKVKEGIISLDEFKKLEKEVYWQVVSNCIILGKSKGEIIAYTPTYEQLQIIRQEIEETNVLEKLDVNPWQARFIIENEFYNLPYIPEWSEFPNFTSFIFEVPTEDVIFLTKKVIEANELLENG